MNSPTNTQLLNFLRLPVIKSTEELAFYMKVDKLRLNKLSWYNKRFYRICFLPKKSGGRRLIRKPCREIKAIQAWILTNILNKLPVSYSSTAYVKRRSIKDNVAPHSKSRYFYNVDIADFFENVEFKRVFYIFRTIGYSKKVSWFLTKLCTCDGVLPQGGVTSGALANLSLERMDRRLERCCEIRGVIFTRYADDLTFSANHPISLSKVRTKINQIIVDEGFQLNTKKTRFSGPSIRTCVTGLIKNNSKNGFGIGRSKKREIRSAIYNYANKCGITKFENESQIEGTLSYVKHVDPVSYNSLSAYWESLKV